MKSKYLLRIVAATLLIIMLIPLMSACATKTDVKIKVENVFKSQSISMPDSFNVNGEMNYSNGRVYVQGYAPPNYQQTLYSVNIDGTDGKTIQLLSDNDNAYIQQIKINGNGDIVYLYNEYFYDEETETHSENFYLSSKDINNNQLLKVNLIDVLKTDDNEYFWVQNMYIDINDYIYITSNQKISILDESGNFLFDIKLSDNTYVNSIFTTKKGDTILIYNDYNNNESNTVAKIIDFNKKDLGSEYNLGNFPIQYMSRMIPSSDEKFDFFYNDNFSIYGYNSASDTSTEILNWINSDIDISYSNSFCIISADEIVSASYNYMNQKSEILFLSRVPDEDIKEKYILTLAAFYLDSTIKAHVIDFNRNNLEYRIQIEDYSIYNTDNDYEAGINKLNTDISTGKVPDILVISSYYMPVSNYAAKGLFMDLNKFIEDDPDINRADYFENVLNAVQYNDKLYQLPTGFYVRTVVGKTKFFGDMNGWTMDEFNTFMALQPEGTLSFQDLTQSEMLNRYCTMMIDDFIDSSTGKANFDSDGFIKVLEFCKTLNDKSKWEDPNFDHDKYWQEMQDAYKEDRVILMDYYLNGFDYFWDTMRVEFGEEISFIGMPTESRNGSALQIMNEFSMSAKTKHSDGAWSFLRQFIMDDYQETLSYGFPIKISYAEKLADKAIDPPEDEYDYYYPMPEISVSEVYDDTSDVVANEAEAPVTTERQKRKNIRYIDGEEVDIGFITREYTDMILEYVKSINNIVRYDSDMINIIVEEANAFFAGQKSAAETAKIIQNRLQNYIDERR